MQLTNDEALRRVTQGVEALQAGRAADARRLFDSVTQTGRANSQIWGLLATACRALGDDPAEEAALDALLALEPGAVRAHVMKGDCRQRSGDTRTALRFYESALLYAKAQQLPPDLAAEVQRVERYVADVQATLAQQRDATITARGFPPEQRSPRFQQSLDILAGTKRIFVQEPTGYYFPGLPQTQYFDRADFAWVPAIEAATDTIRAELQAMLARGTADFRPYMQGDSNRPRSGNGHLEDNADWSTMFLCENGHRFESAIDLCPATWAAVQHAPLPHVINSPTVMFSLLRAGARIAPHSGMLNTRLICHLPLIVPPGCRFRVGNETREWEVGKLIIFDDTIEHEAWNDGEQDRIVLIFDVWRPELSERERQEVSALLAGPALE